MDDYREPDSFEKCLRFSCGFLLGGLVSFIVTLQEMGTSTVAFWGIVVGISLVCGFFAVRYGDSFWRGVSDWFRW